MQGVESDIERWLGSERPHQYWLQILDALDELKNPSDEINKKLEEVKWLPIDTGQSPQDVIYLKGMEDEIAQIVGRSDDFVHVLRLKKEFRRHPGFKILRKKIFPQRDDALAILTEMMEESEEYHIGDIDTEGLNVETFLSIFETDPQLIPAFSMIRYVWKTSGVTECRESLLPKLCHKLPNARTVKILDYLAQNHCTASKNKKQEILNIFNLYLKTAVKESESEFSEILGQIRLLSRDENWKPSTELCLDCEGIQSDDLLHETQVEIVQGKVPFPKVVESNQYRKSLRQDSIEHQFGESVTRLRQYFDTWEETVQREVIGGFLSLLGRGKLLSLIRDYLGNYLVDKYPQQFDSSATSAVETNEDIRSTMSRQRLLVEVVEGDTITVTNLLDSPFKARIEPENFDTLFIGGHFPREDRENYQVYYIQLRSIQSDGFEPERLLSLIKTSARLLLKKVHNLEVPKLDAIFDDLAKSEQLDIQIAQNLLLDSVFFYVWQLDMREKNSKLSTVLRKWDEARHQKIEAAHNNDTKAEQEAEEELQSEQEELQNLLQEDGTTQESLLAAVRRKIGEHYQYTAQSVPFELFQNADDAVVEWFEMQDNPPPEEPGDITRFVVQQEDDQIAFIHWGRAINKYSSTQFDDQERGFNRDLEKMLIFSASDKSESTETITVTGRFGLGFKSVFLVTSKPRVVSGRLGFKVMGGFFPKKLKDDALQALQKQIKAYKIDGREGTIISIKAEMCSVQECLEDFLNLGYLLPVFAKKIKRCDLISDGQTETWSWSDRPIGQSKRVTVGKLQSNSDAHQTAAVLRARQGALLVGFDAHGAVGLDQTVPTVWVTVPTKEQLDFGFIVNGNFELDIGRSQLAKNSKENRNVVDEIGREIGEALIELFDESKRNWNKFCDHLNLDEDTDRYQFWQSLWNLFARGIQEKSVSGGEAWQLIQQMLWKSRNHGMGKLLYHRPAVPNGLWGSYKTLGQTNYIKFKTVGILDTESVFCQASQWPQFQKKIQPKEVVSEKQVASVLMSLIPDELLNHEEVKLCSLVQWELEPNYCVAPSQAAQLGSLITCEFLDELNKSEYAELVELLRKVRFQGGDGKFHIATDLLIYNRRGCDNPDKSFRTAFVTDSKLLADAYTNSALEFFKACREALNTQPQLNQESRIVKLLLESLARSITAKPNFPDRMAIVPRPFSNDLYKFSFAIIGDKTGGGRDKWPVFDDAISEINILQPDFAIMVGDLIQGNMTDLAQLEAEWEEFWHHESPLTVPFLPLPGNHDITNPVMYDYWTKNIGRTYSAFTYKNCLFLLLNTEEEHGLPPGADNWFGKEQLEYTIRNLRQHKAVRHTFVLLHKPAWLNKKSGWYQIEDAMKGRAYTVFAGHHHKLEVETRNDQRYFILGATGGGQLTRDEVKAYSEFNHYPEMAGMFNLDESTRKVEKESVYDHYSIVTVNGDDVTVAIVEPGKIRLP